MTTLVTRAQWGARPRQAGTTSINPTEGVTVHYEGGGWPFPWAHSTCDDKVRAMQADHMDNRGWSDIAYNYLGCPHNYLYEGRGYDRRSSANGYDSANASSFAVQGIWGDASGKPPDDLKRAIRYGIDILRSKGGASNVLKGHRDWKQTSCPGDYLYAWVQQGCPLPTTAPTYEDAEMISPEGLQQVKTAMVAVLDQEVQEGNSLHELVQDYSAFNAENVRQNKDLTIVGTDSVLKDDFNALAVKVDNVHDTVAQMQSTLQAILTKLNTP